MFYHTLCLSGGGLRGITQLMLINSLEKNDILILKKINKFVGTSVGAIISFLYILKYSTKNIIKILLKISDQNSQDDVNLNNLEKYYGINNGGYFIETFTKLLYLKLKVTDITFKQLYKITGKKLLIIGYNLTKNKEVVFSYRTTPNLSVLVGLKISCTIPFYFYPYKIKNDIFLDGALINNFPIKYCNLSYTLGIYIWYPINMDNFNMCTYIYTVLAILGNRFTKVVTHNNIIRIVDNKDDAPSLFDYSIQNNFMKLQKKSVDIAMKKILKKYHFISIIIVNRSIKKAFSELSSAH
uniref:Patatin-like phospholipase n=1 Tax=Megaviridae environmental sample TaxID=1737588 RepID=A0A5J6VKH8_9VIRU|nr:MAG: patatin-like phospholipase [Megaviridae environmental sample]